MTMERLPAPVSVVGISLSGIELPEAIQQTFVEFRIRWQKGNLASIGEHGVESTIYLLWVNDDWQRGFDQLETLPEELRQRAVLTGIRRPSSQVIRDVIRVGALAAVGWPIPAWFFGPLLDAASRSWPAYQRKLSRAVAGLQDSIEHSPKSLLVNAALEAGRLLDADLALATLRLDDRFEVLVRAEHGEILGEPWEADSDRERAPFVLDETILERKEITIIPSADHSTLCRPGRGDDAYRSAVIQPMRVERRGQSSPPIRACIHLYWLQPYLPTPKEVFAVGMLSAIARSSLARLIEHARFSEELSVTPSHPEEASRNLHDLLRIVCERTDSDGAKVFVVLRSPERPRIWQLGNTEVPDKEHRAVPWQAGHGLADWVLDNDDWLLIPDAAPDAETADGKKRCISGKFGDTEVPARSETEYIPDHTSPDGERSMLFVPLHARDKGAGVLAVWRRERPEIYDKNTDPERLRYVAPHIASICHRLLHLRKAREEMEAISTLARALASSDTQAEAYDAVVAGVGCLADAACAVLLHFESGPSQGGPLVYRSALWTAPGLDREAIAGKLERFAAPCVSVAAEWWADIGEALENRNLGLVFRGFLTPTHDDSSPTLGIALLDPLRPESEPTFFSDDLLDQYARSFLQAAAAMLENFAANLASRLDDQIGDISEGEHVTGGQILAHAAKLLRQATGANAALIYSGSPETMRLINCWPPRPDLTGHAVRAQSLTQRSLTQADPIRVLDVDLHEQEMDRENLGVFAQAFGWPRVGSWLCCAVRHGGRSIGLIKIMTHGDGTFLGTDHEEIVHLVAARTAIEMHKANRQTLLENLLKISNEMVAFRGESLGHAMIERLEGWVREALPRESCRVAVSARVAGNRSLLRCGSRGIKPRLLKDLENWSTSHPNQAADPARESAAGDGVFAIGKARGIAAPLGLLDEERLQGHLFLLDDEPFSADEREAIRDAAHYMAIVLDGERERVMSRAALGHFRHAAIGPIMGVSGASTEIAHLAASEPIDHEQLREARSRLRQEIDSVRLWEDNSRFYLSEEVELKLRQQSIKSIVATVIERFEPRAEDRGITLTMVSNKKGGLEMLVDKEALDLAVTNLLDNALKYSFFNRTITIGVDSFGFETIEIWVEDIGHKIDDDARERIYAIGRRAIEPDPFRSIRGQGLGLYMVGIIVAAHGGQLDHMCEQLGAGEDPETTPYKVRFTIELPTRRQF